jgi:TIR domain-containing protein
MAVKFFVSYSRNDDDSKRLVVALQSELKRYGHEVFVDLTMNVGTEWEEELKRKIAWSDEFILLLSPPAVASEPVRDEIRHANALSDALKRPRILPVYVNFDGPLDRELQKILGPIQHLTWRSDADTEVLVANIRAALAARRHPRVVRTAAAAIVVVMVLVLFVYCRAQVSVLTRSGVSDAGAVASYHRLRRMQWLLVPRLWLIGRWNPDVLMRNHLSASARRLDEKAAPGLRSDSRDELDRALVLSALAGLQRGLEPSIDAVTAYRREGYDKLLATMRSEEEMYGRSLAVRLGSGEWRISAGERIWTCRVPIGSMPCEAEPVNSQQPAVISSAFESDDQLLVVGYRGVVTRLELNRQAEPAIWRDGRAVTVDGSDVAIGFDDHAPATGHPSVIAYARGQSTQTSPMVSIGGVTSLAFGPCSDCVTLLGTDGSMKVWFRVSGEIRSVRRAGTTAAIAASRAAGRLAVIDQKGTLAFYDRNLGTPSKRPIDLGGSIGLAMSHDGRRLAVVHASSVMIIEDDLQPRILVSAVRTPTPVAAIFAGDDTVVTRTQADVRIWRLSSPKGENAGPLGTWSHWRNQFGFAAGSGKTEDRPGVIGWDPVARDAVVY